MRQQAKPFTVEIKKSRKSNHEPQPLFGDLLVAEAEPKPKNGGDGLFGQRPEAATSNGHANGLFGTPSAEPARPATRILPDLTVREAAAVEDEPARTRKPRVAKTKGPRIPKAKPLPVTLVEAPVARAVAKPAAAIRVRRRDKDESGLARADRWKRRLPRFAR